MKIRIAVYTCTQSFWGGAFQYDKALTEALALLDKEKYSVAVWHEADDEWKALCARNGFQEFVFGELYIPNKALPFAQKMLAQLKSLPGDDAAKRNKLAAAIEGSFSASACLEKYDPHILISPQMVDVIFRKNACNIAVIHDLMHKYEQRFPEAGSESEVRIRDERFGQTVDNCDVILVDSAVGRRHVLETFPRARDERIRILPFTAFNDIMQAMPQKPDFPLPEKFFFYPASFWLHKNHAGLARAVAALKEELPDMTIVASGNTKQNGYAPFMEVVEKYSLQKNFIVPGYLPVEQLRWLYEHARALIMPTYFGPTNIPPLEAMALGCPVAISGVYGMPEQCGKAALYFDPANDAQIADAMRKLWQNDALCSDLKKQGLLRAGLYNVDAFNKNVLRIVTECAEKCRNVGAA